MKYRVAIYAKALVAAMGEAKTPADAKKIKDRFLRLLEKNGDFRKAKDIIELAEAEYLEKRGNKKITLEAARNVDAAGILKHIYQEGDMVLEKINPEVVAGIKIIINDERQLDFSLQKKLDDIFA